MQQPCGHKQGLQNQTGQVVSSSGLCQLDAPEQFSQPLRRKLENMCCQFAPPLWPQRLEGEKKGGFSVCPISVEDSKMGTKTQALRIIQ